MSGRLGFWIGLLSVALIAYFIGFDGERVTPGVLAAVHADLPELQGIQGCDGCHDRQSADLCGGCHESFVERLQLGKGLHAELDEQQLEDCGHCHVEHLAGAIPLSGEIAFERSGYQGREDYDHRGFEIDEDGKHADLECVECHLLADAKVLATGEKRYVVEDPSCSGCHEDPHEGELPACLDCHLPDKSFEELSGFEHGESCPLLGGHAGLECSDCHAADTAYSIEALGAADSYAIRACEDCHEQPHAAAFLAALGPAQGSQLEQCGPCHTGEHTSFAWHQAGVAREVDPSWHDKSGFPLSGAHAELECASCHDSELLRQDSGFAPEATQPLSFAMRYPNRLHSDCAACHEDIHGGQFAAIAPEGGPSCVDCHEHDSFVPSTFSIEAHEQTRFPLLGAHAALSCSECHANDPQQKQQAHVYRTGELACSDCHADAHVGALLTASSGGEAAPELESANESNTDCASCHEQDRWDEVPEDSFDHNQHTRYALTGSHLDLDCDLCHIERLAPDENGRSLGWIADSFGTPVDACGTCHEDVHWKLFDAAEAYLVESAAQLPAQPAREGAFSRLLAEQSTDGLRRAATGQTGCEVCHLTTRFDDVESFDHEYWTGYALRDAHLQAKCEACHPRSKSLDATRRFGRVDEAFGKPAQACVTCHTDVHEGDFAAKELPQLVNGGAGCARCHDEERFDRTHLEHFDHELWTDFALEGAHDAISCEDCHERAELPDADDRHFGHALGSACDDCHADPHLGQFGTGQDANCESCHAADAATFEELSFDHELDSSFQLGSLHAEVRCDACHKLGRISAGAECVRYKPLGSQCIDCHSMANWFARALLPAKREGGGKK